MKKSFAPKTFLCKCGTYNIDYVWSDNIKTECTNCGKKLDHTNIPKTEAATAIRTPTKNR